MSGHVSQYARKGANPHRVVSWNSDVVLPTLHGGQPHVATMLAGDLVTENPQGMRELIASQIAGQSHGFKLSSSSKHFLPDKTKKDHTGTLSLIEVATNGIQHIRAHFIERVGFCKTARLWQMRRVGLDLQLLVPQPHPLELFESYFRHVHAITMKEQGEWGSEEA